MTPFREAIAASLAPRYILQRELGRGGMATVFLADDVKHSRAVAVKVMHPQFCETLSAERFLQEIAILSRLTHPQIVPLHDSGGGDDLLWYVTPFIDGGSVRDRLDRDRCVPIDEAIRLVGEIADALDYAHARGIIHRDLKPENILLTGKRPLVADFGIASASEDTRTGLTAPGVMVGTLAYMSPEQMFGESTVGPASDVFSLACVFHELVCGEPPAGARSVTPQALLAARLRETSIQSPLPGGSPALEAALTRALARVPAQRFQAAGAFALSLRESLSACEDGRGTRSSTAPAIQVPEIGVVVLPFENLSADPDNAYFADGLTEEIISDLTRIRALRVISRTSAMALRGQNRGTPSICRQLDVQFALEGSVRRAGNQLRITAQLVDGPADRPIWSEKYSGTTADIFDLQERLSRTIVEQLRVALTPQEERRLAERSIADPRLLECYQRARHQIWRMTREGLEAGQRIVEQGLTLLGEHPLLEVALGSVHWAYVNWGISADPSHVTAAYDRANRALAADPQCSQAHLLLGFIKGSRGDMRAALEHLRHSARLEPDDPEMLAYLGILSGFAGQTDRGRPLVERLLRIDPLTPLNWTFAGHLSLFQGRFDEAVAHCERGVDLDASGSAAFRMLLSFVLLYAGDRARALTVLSGIADGEAGFEGLSRAYRALLTGSAETAISGLTPTLLDWASHDLQYSWFVATIYSMAERHDQAIEWLERAGTLGFCNYPFFANHDRLLDPIRSHPRFDAVLEAIRVSWAALQG